MLINQRHINVFLLDKIPHLFIVQDVLSQSAPATRRPVAHGGQVVVQAIASVNPQMLGQMIRPGESLFADLTPAKR